MMHAFTKMHGLGNDVVLIDCETDADIPSREILIAWGDRRRGIGFDQLLAILPPRDPAAHAAYRVFNHDGTEVEQCGNGVRCMARYFAQQRDVADQPLVFESAGGTVRAYLEDDGLVTVEMGVPDFAPAALPFLATRREKIYTIEAAEREVSLSAVSIGNPHVVIAVDAVATAPVGILGPALASHELFPRGTNVGFVERLERDAIRLRVYERGAGETLACGTGACAAVVIGIANGCLDSQVRVQLPGGSLSVRWESPREPVWLTGEAVTSFEGKIDT